MGKEIELRQIKIVPDASNDSFGYSGELYFEAKKVASVKNAGDGSPDEVHWYKPEARQLVEDHFKGQPPAVLKGHGLDGKKIQPCLEFWCADQAAIAKAGKDYRKESSRHVLVHHEGQIYKTKKPKELNDAFRKELLEARPGGIILNDLPDERAVKLFIGDDIVAARKDDPFEATPEELEKQATRQDVRNRLEPQVPGETQEEADARRERNNRRLAEIDPKAAAQVAAVAALTKRRQDLGPDVHPGSRLKMPEGKSKTREERAAEPVPEGSLRDRLKKKGSKPIKEGSKKDVVAKLVCRPGGASTAEIVAAIGTDAHDVGNQIFYLKHQHGYTIPNVGGKYVGQPPQEDAAPAAPPEGEQEAAA